MLVYVLVWHLLILYLDVVCNTVFHSVTEDAFDRHRAVWSCSECIWWCCCSGKCCYTLYCLAIIVWVTVTGVRELAFPFLSGVQWWTKKQELTSVGLTYIHTCRSYVHSPCDFTNSASLAWHLRRRISTVMFTCRWTWPARSLICPIFGFWRSSVHKNGRFPALDADNHREQFDAASFILGGEIHNRTNKKTHNKQ